MARKGSKAKSTPTKYKNAFNVRSVGKSYLSLGIGTKLVFNTNPIEFFGGGLLPGYQATGQGQSKITAYELFNWTAGSAYGVNALGAGTASYGSSVMDTVGYNVKNGAVRAIGESIALKVGDKGLQKIGVYRSFNKLVRSAGLGDLIKM
tara:strand:- start:374 stop:820 length:447 start_codon:yes stop_codon:yes gene_type:complete